jgi:DNA (cytosine-5)-methyltransferase 1
MSEPLLFGSYFSGGGLADVGAKMAGFVPAFGVEGDPERWELSMRIADAYEANIGTHLVRQPVQDVQVATLPQVTWFHASPVCKSFSMANQEGAENEVDIATAQATANYITHHRPPFVTIENVWAYHKATSWQKILAQALIASGYKYRIDHINMADYGVPQTRKRMVVTAILNATSRPPRVPPTHEKNPRPSLFDFGLKRWVSWYEALEDLLPSLPITEFSTWQLSGLPKDLRTAMITVGKYNGRTVYADADRPAHTITANTNQLGLNAFLLNDSSTLDRRDATLPAATQVASGRNGMQKIFLPEEGATLDSPQGRIVRITPEAIARLQSVPPSYTLPERGKDAITLLGNGVPSLFMQRVGEWLRESYPKKR